MNVIIAWPAPRIKAVTTPPTRAPTMPMSTVRMIPIRCRPGTRRWATAPITSPMISHVMMVMRVMAAFPFAGPSPVSGQTATPDNREYSREPVSARPASRAAEDPREGAGDLGGQPAAWHVFVTALVRGGPGAGGPGAGSPGVGSQGRRLGVRVPGQPAVQAFHLVQPPDQARAAATGTAGQVRACCL